MSFTNVQTLSTYLSTAVAGGAATTALSLVLGTTPVFFNFTGDTTPHYSIGTPTTVQTLANAQLKYNPVLFPQGGSATGITMGDSIGLLWQAFKDLNPNVPIITTTTTNASGVATVDLTPYAFSAAPNVQLTTQTTVGGPAVVANITSLSATSLSIQTLQSQNILLGIVNPFTPVSKLVQILLTA